jgi:hypothetical protein
MNDEGDPSNHHFPPKELTPLPSLWLAACQLLDARSEAASAPHPMRILRGFQGYLW